MMVPLIHLSGIVQEHIGVQPGLHGSDVNPEPRHVLAQLQRVAPSVGGVENLPPGPEASTPDLFRVRGNVDGVDVRAQRVERHGIHDLGHLVRQPPKYLLSVGGGAVPKEVATTVVAAADSQRSQHGPLVGDSVLRGNLFTNLVKVTYSMF